GVHDSWLTPQGVTQGSRRGDKPKSPAVFLALAFGMSATVAGPNALVIAGIRRPTRAGERKWAIIVPATATRKASRRPAEALRCADRRRRVRLRLLTATWTSRAKDDRHHQCCRQRGSHAFRSSPLRRNSQPPPMAR